MYNYAWIIPSDKADTFNRGGISLNYILPKNHISIDPIKLRGARIWLIVRGREDRCIALIAPKKIERFSDGYHEGDFVVTSDLMKSIKLASGFDAARPYQTGDTSQHSIGLSPMTDRDVMILSRSIKSNMQVKLRTPSIDRRNNLKLSPIPKPAEAGIRMVMSHVVQHFSMDQIWGSGTGRKLTPFANFASHLITSEGIDLDAVNLDVLLKIDPLNLLAMDLRDVSTESLSREAREKRVDLDFVEIDPETIYAREFLFSNSNPLSIEAALEKTEASEKIHQDMLRDISTYVKKHNLMPYQSDSVDLMIELGGKIKIFEIKSANDENLVAQSAKGAFQVAWYLEAMIPSYDSITGHLIIHKIRNGETENLVKNALKRLGIDYLIYNPSLDWPERVSGLLS